MGGTLTYEEWLAFIRGETSSQEEGSTSLRTGTGVPSSTLGNDGDSYIDTATWDYYVKVNGSWIKIGNIKGADGSDGSHTEETFTVTYYPNGGALPQGYEETVTVAWGDTLDLPTPTYENHTFDGWFINEGSGYRQWYSTDAVFADLDLYAQWTEVPPVSETVEVTFWHTFGQSATAALDTLARQFEDLVKKNEDIDVNITLAYKGGYDDIFSMIMNGYATGSLPTMAIAYPDHVANYLATNTNTVYDLTSYMNDEEIGFRQQAYLGDKEGADDFVEAFLEEGSSYAVEGIYSLPIMKSTEVMYYNTEAVTEGMASYALADGYRTAEDFIASLDWDGLLAFASHCLDNKSSVLPTLEYPIWYDSDSNLFLSQMFQREIGYSSIVNGAGQIDFESGTNRTAAEAMVNEIKTAYDAGIITTRGIEGTYGSDAFANGEVIFEIGSSSGAGYNVPSSGTFTPGVTPVPASRGTDGNVNPLYVSQGPSLTFFRSPALDDEVNDARMEMAWRFAKYLTNPDQNVYMCIYGSQGYVPVRYTAYETEVYAQYIQDAESLQAKTVSTIYNRINGKYFNVPAFKGSSQLRDECGGIVTRSLWGFKTVTAAFDDAIRTAKTYF